MKTIRPINQKTADVLTKNTQEQIKDAKNDVPKNQQLKVEEQNDLAKKEQTIEDVMKQVLEDNTNTITFSVTLTKRQYDKFIKKGGVKWLKNVIVGIKKKG